MCKKLATFFLTDDRRQRITIINALLSSLVFLICAGLIAYLTSIGIVDKTSGQILYVIYTVSNLLFYLILRSGVNLHFTDHALVLPQTLVALTCVAIAYTITNEAHSGTLLLVGLILVFGIFNTSQRRARITSLYAVCVMGLAMLYKSWDDPQLYPPQIEFANFVILVSVVFTISVLGAQLDVMRQTLKRQKADLSDALGKISEMATRDVLTGLINRRKMRQVLTDYVALNQRQMADFSIALIDLDYFKQVNDTYGHSIGDEVLSNFSIEAERVLRETDIIARWGGEEFLVLMPHITPDAPSIAIERLSKALEKFQASPSKPDLRITFSAGMTIYRSGESMDNAMERADKLLYKAKSAGRNQLLIG
jgi:diguanylate cyclase (GGDEF)-like protein